MIPAGGPRGVVEAALAWRAEGRSLALVVVTATEGSTYRKAGAIAAVADDGRRAGVISGGCLEPSVDALARDAMAAAAPRAIVLDTRRDDDLLFGSGSGCRGRMHVLALPERRGSPCVALDALAGAWSRGMTAELALPEGVALSLKAPPHVLLVGAGPAAPPLLRLARTMGWRTTLVDHREALLAPSRVGDADCVLQARPRAAFAELRSERFDAAIVMTHGAETDLEALGELARGDIARIGLLGPPARRDELLARLTEQERASLHSRLHAPAGMRLGGEGPEAIALAIAAELQHAFHPEP